MLDYYIRLREDAGGEAEQQSLQKVRDTFEIFVEQLTRLVRDLSTVLPVVPPRVDYELTDPGHGLQGILAQLTEWAFAHSADVAKARAEYDDSAS